VLESLIDLTYRGISLGKRIKLTGVRPTTGFIELASPMPVGTEISITADDGVAFGATVMWVHEQVAGSDRAPGMIVSPRLFGDAAGWWQARVALPEDDTARPTLARNRPVTVRPRSHTQPSPGPSGAPQAMPAIIADLDARVAGARPAVDPRTRPAEPGMSPTGDHAVIDDGAKTTTMSAVDPASLPPEDEDDDGDGDDGDGTTGKPPR
jgi:hypothetical protein